jgi:hypothetical protein
MRITGLVFMAATFYHNCLKEASEENIFLCYCDWTPARVGGREPLFLILVDQRSSNPQHIDYPLNIAGKTSS